MDNFGRLTFQLRFYMRVFYFLAFFTLLPSANSFMVRSKYSTRLAIAGSPYYAPFESDLSLREKVKNEIRMIKEMTIIDIKSEFRHYNLTVKSILDRNDLERYLAIYRIYLQLKSNNHDENEAKQRKRKAYLFILEMKKLERQKEMIDIMGSNRIEPVGAEER